MLKEFKKFILRGNVIDLAVGLVIGTAFNAIVQSLVKDIIMPFVGYITAGVNFTELKIMLAEAEMAGEEVLKPEVAITYGNLIQVIIQFLIVALVIFFIVKGINHMRDAAEKRMRRDAGLPEEAPAADAPPADVVLLTEIRDLLKKDQA
ncbi:MAG: large-conductance mechanosensitive channel protein MscL [Clostridia bacterium]|nr:large-conductance mechanosensitive channel protein MscL [Eubacteriales bacterium]MDD4462250.1 large-conductance mechanosensitive channel protein MscL [Eubacteriales bacterium]NCC48505.1 large-conductance mechanosensitive channel protein MscL [Clostridia bacterium]